MEVHGDEATTLHLKIKVDSTSEASSSADWGSPPDNTHVQGCQQGKMSEAAS